MTNVIIDGKAYCAETLLNEVRRLTKDIVASTEAHKNVLESIKAEIDERYDIVKCESIDCACGLEMALGIIEKYIDERG